jgi:outer membrane protein assembly factor BamA
LDVSGFLDEKYGFLPIAMPITEPAVGYGVAGALAFIDQPLGAAESGYGRPNVSVAGGMGTENGTWGTVMGDMRHWHDDRVQTLAALIYCSVNLDFHGLGHNDLLSEHPLRYTLEPKGGFTQGKYRLGISKIWVGLSYAFVATDVRFEAPDGTPGLPDTNQRSTVGGLTPSLTYDTRDNIFTTGRGTYVELTAGLFSGALGGDDEFQRARLIAMQFFPFGSRWFLGMRGETAASFGDEPFYLRPFLNLRGVPIMR